jgi:hypothetical protein
MRKYADRDLVDSLKAERKSDQRPVDAEAS